MPKKIKNASTLDLDTFQSNYSEKISNPFEDRQGQALAETLKLMYIGIFSLFNTILMACAYSMLIFQTLYIVGGVEPKYINLRHIAIKWLITYALLEIKRGYSHKLDINSQLMIIGIDCVIILISFPSQTLKSIHLKYFSHKEEKKFQNSVKDPKSYDITFGQRLLTSIIIMLLTLVKHMIAFVPPKFRKSLEQPIRNINKVMVQRKCFWSIYEQNKQKQEDIQKSKKSILESIIPTIDLSSSFVLGASKQKEIRAFAEQCSVHTMKPMKKISIRYNSTISQLEITDLDFNKSTMYTLEQLIQQDNTILEFRVVSGERNQQDVIIAKFKSPKELQSFLKSIEQVEQMI